MRSALEQAQRPTPIWKSVDQAVAENMGLVHACAHRLKGRSVEYEDLVQAGCMGLVKAASAFEPERGLQFSTYAVPVILGEMRRLFRDGGAVKVGRSIKELSTRVARERERFVAEFDREPAVSELAQRLSVSEEKVAQAVASSWQPLSLSESDEEGGGQFDIPVASPEEAVSDRLGLQQVLGQLDANDRALIVLRYFRGLTQSQTAAQLGMTQVQVSRREKKILGELRGRLE